MTFYIPLLGIISLTTILFGLLPLLERRVHAPPRVGEQLRMLRREQRLSYVELASRTGLPARLLAELELGLCLPQPSQLTALAAAFGTPGALAYNPPAQGLVWHGRGALFRTAIAGIAVVLNIVLLALLTPSGDGTSSIWLMALPAACIAGLLLWLHRPTRASKPRHTRYSGLILVLTNQLYAIVSIVLAWHAPNAVSIIHAVAVTWNAAVTCLSIFNQLWPRDELTAPPLPTDPPEVAAVIPTYGEPIAVLEPVLRSLLALDYPRTRLHIFISDDGRRPEVADLAQRYGVSYLPGPQQHAKAGNLNQAMAAIKSMHPHCDLLLTQDADDTLAPGFLRAVVGYFSEPLVAFVQTPKDCVHPNGDIFGNRERIFFHTLQPGRNGANAAFACGSGVIWRMSAVESIGGFDTWNLVEDLTTSYKLHSAGYDSRYHNEVFSVGLAPEDIPGILKQRGTWAVDTLRLFLFDNPLWNRGLLSLRQRMQYLEQGFFYLTSALINPLLFLVPVLALLSGQFIANAEVLALLWTTSACANLYYYGVVSNGRAIDVWRTWQYIMGHSPTYLRALWTALWSRHHKPKYVVTRKTRLTGFHGQLLWPQFTAIAVGMVSIVYGALIYGPTYPGQVVVNSGFVIYYVLMLSGICRAAFYGVPTEELPLVGPALGRWFASHPHAAVDRSEALGAATDTPAELI